MKFIIGPEQICLFRNLSSNLTVFSSNVCLIFASKMKTFRRALLTITHESVWFLKILWELLFYQKKKEHLLRKAAVTILIKRDEIKQTAKIKGNEVQLTSSFKQNLTVPQSKSKILKRKGFNMNYISIIKVLY